MEKYYPVLWTDEHADELLYYLDYHMIDYDYRCDNGEWFIYPSCVEYDLKPLYEFCRVSGIDVIKFD